MTAVLPTGSAGTDKPQGYYRISIEPQALAHYARSLRLPRPQVALQKLAQTIAASPLWKEMSVDALVVRAEPLPTLAVLGRFDEVDEARLKMRARALSRACARLSYIDYHQVERDCRRLAIQIRNFADGELSRLHFAAIARGGLIVLGMVAYELGLDQAQLGPPKSSRTPLVVVDDIALTGARFNRFLNGCGAQHIVFAHLYSHPDLRAAVKSQESRVIACLSAQDLHDYGPESLGDTYRAWQERWLTHLEGHRYWVGQPNHVCFPWNEPDRPLYNARTEKMESGWRIIPPERCLKNRPLLGSHHIPVLVQPESQYPLKPSDNVIFAEYDGQILIGDLETGKGLSLANVAADMWKAIVTHGSLQDTMDTLIGLYDIDRATLRADLEAFVAELQAQGLLEC